MGATLSPASHLLEADEILFPYPLLSCELEELSAINQWRQNKKGVKEILAPPRAFREAEKNSQANELGSEPRTGPAYPCFGELRLNRQQRNMPRVFYNPVDIDPVLIDAYDFHACMRRLQSDLEDFEEDCGKKNHTQALLNLIHRLAVIIDNTEEALRDL